MLADQRKTRLIVIECDALAPVDVVVAALAALAELAPMRVLTLVARDACRLQLVAIEKARVACVALQLRMRAM